MVINNFDFFRTGLGPAEAHLKLFVDSNAVLTSTTSRQRFQHVAGWHFKIVQFTCSLELPNFSQGNALEIDKAPNSATASQLLGILTLER